VRKSNGRMGGDNSWFRCVSGGKVDV